MQVVEHHDGGLPRGRRPDRPGEPLPRPELAPLPLLPVRGRPGRRRPAGRVERPSSPARTARQGHSGGAPSSCEQRPTSTQCPRSRASSASSPANRLLPMPASPVSTANAGRPASAAASATRSAASSASRPTIGQGGPTGPSAPTRRLGPAHLRRLGGGTRSRRAAAGCVPAGATQSRRSSWRSTAVWRSRSSADGSMPELLVEHLAQPAQHLERVRLASGAGQRERPQRPEPLAQRVGRRQRLQLPGHGPVPAQGEAGDGPGLQPQRPQLLEPGALRHGGGGVPQLGVRRAAPAASASSSRSTVSASSPRASRRRAQQGRAEPVVRGRHGLLEEVRVDGVVGHPQRVPGRDRHQHGGGRPPRPVRLEHPPQLRDVGLQRGGDAGRRGLAPEQVDDRVDRDRPAARERERGHQRALLRRPEVDRRAVEDDLHRAEDRHLHHAQHRAAAGPVGAPSRLPVGSKRPADTVSTTPTDEGAAP